MAWTHLKKNSGMGHEEQWLYKIGTAPACCLKRGEQPGTWVGSLLNTSGIACAVLHVHGVSTLEKAQLDCEAELRRMGWEEDNANISQTI